MENQFRVGDLVTLGDHQGQVERMTLRTTLLRDIEGVLHIVPNGEIKSIRNHTHGWSQVKLDIGVAYEADLERVMAVAPRDRGGTPPRPPVREHDHRPARGAGGRELRRFPGDRARHRQDQGREMQMDVAREFRRRIRESFRRQGIEAPYPHRVIIGDTRRREGSR